MTKNADALHEGTHARTIVVGEHTLAGALARPAGAT